MPNGVMLNAEQIKEIWEKDGSWKKFPLNFYVHFPFCISKCNYCHYPSVPLHTQHDITDYIKNMTRNMGFFQQTFLNSSFSNLYVGGGTPSLMTRDHIHSLFSYVLKNFSFDKNGEKTFECNPESLTVDKVRLLKKLEFNRISLGIQSIDQQVLKSENRSYQNFEKIKKISSEIVSNDFVFNVDLILGLRSDTAKKFLNSFRSVVSLQPTSITIYQLRPTKKYIAINCTNVDTLSQHYKALLKSTYEELNIIAKINGYKQIGSWRSMDDFRYVSNGRHQNLGHHYESHTINPTSCFGVGTFSASRILHSFFYNCVSKEAFNPRNRIYDTFKIGLNLASIRFIFDVINRNCVLDLEKFKEYFNYDLLLRYNGELSFLKKLKKIKIKKNKLKFNFNSFKEQFFYLLLFLDEAQLKKFLAKQK